MAADKQENSKRQNEKKHEHSEWDEAIDKLDAAIAEMQKNPDSLKGMAFKISKGFFGQISNREVFLTDFVKKARDSSRDWIITFSKFDENDRESYPELFDRFQRYPDEVKTAIRTMRDLAIESAWKIKIAGLSFEAKDPKKQTVTLDKRMIDQLIKRSGKTARRYDLNAFKNVLSSLDLDVKDIKLDIKFISYDTCDIVISNNNLNSKVIGDNSQFVKKLQVALAEEVPQNSEGKVLLEHKIERVLIARGHRIVNDAGMKIVDEMNGKEFADLFHQSLKTLLRLNEQEANDIKIECSYAGSFPVHIINMSPDVAKRLKTYIEEGLEALKEVLEESKSNETENHDDRKSEQVNSPQPYPLSPSPYHH